MSSRIIIDTSEGGSDRDESSCEFLKRGWLQNYTNNSLGSAGISAGVRFRGTKSVRTWSRFACSAVCKMDNFAVKEGGVA